MLSDEQLIAYVENTLDAEERARVEAALADEPDALRRVLKQEQLDRALRLVFADAAATERLKQSVLANVSGVSYEELRARVLESATPQVSGKQSFFNRRAWKEFAPAIFGWRSLAWTSAALAVVALGLVLWPKQHNIVPQQEQTVAVAKLVDVGAQVVVVRNGSENAVQDGFDLRVGDTIRVGVTRTTVVYPDATRLQFGANSRLTLGFGGASASNAASAKQIYFEKGNLTATVSQQAEGSALIFLTPQATVTVVGTVFSLAVDAHKTRLDVTEGLVRVTHVRTRQSIEVAANQFAVAARDVQLRPLPQEEVVDPTATDQEKPPRKSGPHGRPVAPPVLQRHGQHVPSISPPDLQKKPAEDQQNIEEQKQP